MLLALSTSGLLQDIPLESFRKPGGKKIEWDTSAFWLMLMT
jgi:hypothetical protein